MPMFTARSSQVPCSYSEWDSLLGDRSQVMAMPNTTVRRIGEDIVATLHATDIVTYHRDGSFTLDSGGWETVTTKQRMNALLPPSIRVFAERRVWKVTRRFGVYGTDTYRADVFPFKDGISVR